jgi:hypothetical protein
MIWLVLSLAFQDPAAGARGGTLRRYDMFTTAGTVAVREFLDEAGQIEKEVFYDAPVWKDRSDCTPEKLRVKLSTTYVRDSEGRPLIEKRYGRDARLEATTTIAYHGPGRDSYTRTTFGPRVNFGARSGMTMPSAPTLSSSSMRADAWLRSEGRWQATSTTRSCGDRSSTGGNCGLGLPTGSGALGDGTIAMHLRNHTGQAHTAWFRRAFETDLRDAAGRLVPLTADYIAQDHDLAMRDSLRAGSATAGFRGILVESGGAAFDGIDLALRYGNLAPGRYTLAAGHPHPETAAMLGCNTLTFELPSR